VDQIDASPSHVDGIRLQRSWTPSCFGNCSNHPRPCVLQHAIWRIRAGSHSFSCPTTLKFPKDYRVGVLAESAHSERTSRRDTRQAPANITRGLCGYAGSASQGSNATARIGRFIRSPLFESRGYEATTRVEFPLIRSEFKVLCQMIEFLIDRPRAVGRRASLQL
jgi:hypothetical protein